MEGLTGLLRPHGKEILERVVRAMSTRLQHLDPQFSLSHMADLVNTEVDKKVDSSNFLAYCSVVNMKAEGTLGDERTIAVQSSPAVVKRRASAAFSLGGPTHGCGLLDLDKQGHLNVLEFLKPNWEVKGGGREREGGGGGMATHWVLGKTQPTTSFHLLP
jgi:hypothetical protein